MKLDYLDYQIEQFEDTHTASVYYKGKEVIHLSLARRLSEEELIESIAQCFAAIRAEETGATRHQCEHRSETPFNLLQ